jgi:hypothetical protein
VLDEWDNWTITSSLHGYSFAECSGTNGVPSCGGVFNRISIHVGVPPGAQPGYAGYATTDFDGLTGAPDDPEIWLNLNDPTIYNQSNVAQFLEAVKKAFRHEMGHLHGLADQEVNLSNPNCGGQTAGLSIMNAMCGINDSSGNLPTSLGNCDKSGISGGGGGPGNPGGGPGTPGDPNPCDPYWDYTCQLMGGHLDSACNCHIINPPADLLPVQQTPTNK